MDPKILILSKAKPFSGAHGQNWNQWVNRFEAQTASFSDADRTQCLVALLGERALDSYASLPDKVKASYSETKAALAARYGSDVGILQAQAELAWVMQGPGESVVDFADRIRLLGRAAYPRADETDASVQTTHPARADAEAETRRSPAVEPKGGRWEPSPRRAGRRGGGPVGSDGGLQTPRPTGRPVAGGAVRARHAHQARLSRTMRVGAAAPGAQGVGVCVVPRRAAPLRRRWRAPVAGGVRTSCVEGGLAGVAAAGRSVKMP